MKRHPVISAAIVLALWAGAAQAAPPDLPPEQEEAASLPSLDTSRSTWIPVEARNHLTGASGHAAVLFGIAQERGRHRQASLRVECFDGVMAVHMDADRLSPGTWVVAVRYSFDGGRFVSASFRPSADGTGLALSGERAAAFASELHGKAELRLGVVRPLSVPLVFTFVVADAEARLGPLAERCWPEGPSVSDAGR